MIPDLGQIKGMVGQFLGVGFGHDLNEQGPAGEIALFDVLIEIALMAFTILGDNGFGFGVGQVFDALLRPEMEFHPEAFVVRVDEAECVAAESVHVAVARRNAAIAHDDRYLMQRFGQEGPEVPVVFGAVHVGAGIAFDHVVQVGEFQRVAEEEDWRVVAHEIPVALIRIEFDGEAADVAFGVSGAAFARNRGETHEQIGFFADLGEQGGFSIAGDVVGNRKRAVCAGAFGVHTAFGNDFTVEMGQLFEEPRILKQHGAARPGGEGVFVIDYRSTGVVCEQIVGHGCLLWVFPAGRVGLRRCKETEMPCVKKPCALPTDKSITIINIDNKDSLLSFIINLLL